MKILFNYLSIVLFYIAYQFYTHVPAEIVYFVNSWLPISLVPANKSYAIYFAVLVGIIVAGLYTLFQWLLDGKSTKLQLFTFLIFLSLGGITLFLRDPAFIKWKPTVINFIFAVILFGSTIFGTKPLAERIMGGVIDASSQIWHKITYSWATFFLFIATLNIIVAYKFSESIWVNFKLFGILGLSIFFLMLQALYLSKHLQVKE